ncbi:hypothetical protein [Polyangium jinanense]|uniref:Uncharacterized protein n=1 Tax=Polyangium jinanense TaxID=2829994 RepID=A0A9X4AV43_9BACT|nr:hypothetical protein [Polyangium jinanense]MDC3985924.1 hypothetical protein [Polyangium jinanense]
MAASVRLPWARGRPKLTGGPVMFLPAGIVYRLPSKTEICFALALGDRVVGVSHECDYLPEVPGRSVAVALATGWQRHVLLRRCRRMHIM